MIITDCNCGKKLNCGCTLSFSSYIANPTSVLDVGSLLGGTCSYDEYVIDWYRNGQYYMTSGKGYDPEITAFHPFTGAAAIPVQGGTYIPVLRYVILTGESTKIFPSKKDCQDWCNFNGTLPTITVNSLNCASSGGSPAFGYQYRINYNTTQDYSLASRSVRWDLPDDLSVINMAFSFTASSVADKIEIFFKDETTPLMAWIIGFNLNTNIYTAMPYKRQTSSYFKFVVKMPTYAAGDWIIIKITPSVLETNILTIWDLSIKCLTASTVFDCGFLTRNMHTYDLPATRLDWDSVNCRYVSVLKAIEPMPNFQNSADVNYPFYLYADLRFTLSTNAYYNRAANEMGCYLNFNKTATVYWWTITNYAGQFPLTGNVNFKKVSNIFTLTCAEQTDYDWYKANYNLQIAKTFYTDWTTDTTNIKHYRYWRMYWQSMPGGCGDTSYSPIDVRISLLSTFVFDDTAKTITITAVNFAANDIPVVDCSDARTKVDEMIPYLGYTLTAADFNQDTLCSYPLFGHGIGYSGIAINKVTSYNVQSGVFFYSPYTTPCGDTMNDFYMHPTSPANYEWFTHFIKTVITAAVDSNGDFIEDPRDNFRIEDMLDLNTRALAQPWTYTRIYEKSGGIQIYP